MKAYIAALVFVLSLGLTGCPTPIKPEPTVTDTAPITAAANKVEVAANKIEEIQKKIDAQKVKSLSKAAASVLGMRKANGENPDGNPKKTVELEGEVASNRLPEPEREDLLEVMQRVQLGLAGKFDQLKEFYDKASKDLADEKIARAKSDAEKEIALKDKEAAKSEARNSIAKAQADADARIAEKDRAFQQERTEKDDEIRRLGQSNATKAWAGKGDWLAGIAICAYIYAFFNFYVRKDPVAGFTALSGGVLSTLGSIGCYMLASFVGSAIFLKLSIGICLVIVVAAIVAAVIFFIVHSKDKFKKAEAEKGKEEIEMGNYVYQELHEAFQKAKIIAPDAAAIIGGVFQKELSNDSKAFIDRTALNKKEAALPK